MPESTAEPRCCRWLRQRPPRAHCFIPLMEYFPRKIPRIRVVCLKGIFIVFPCFWSIEKCCRVWKISQQLLRSREQGRVTKPEPVIPGPHTASAHAVSLARDTLGSRPVHARRGCKKPTVKETESRTIQMRYTNDQTKKTIFFLPSLIFFFFCCIACSENAVPSFHFSVTHQKVFSATSWASCGPCSNRHSTHICGVQWTGTKGFSDVFPLWQGARGTGQIEPTAVGTEPGACLSLQHSLHSLGCRTTCPLRSG